ncbi:Nose resistant to fluoxetine protein 6 [Paragonimus heterotremus]|uniref:Nose resistant to fluoxetine protein 6 n=1 Tax=Paragonimus heterotremus TaxID=100268 RepID=A0A8J4SRK2_9TREM|nr:Nose resistant to fluoxetine protein 6 [Paragonimus heterotremus]
MGEIQLSLLLIFAVIDEVRTKHNVPSFQYAVELLTQSKTNSLLSTNVTSFFVQRFEEFFLSFLKNRPSSVYASTCWQDIRTIISATMNQQPKAFQWLDSVGRPLPGITGGARIWPGSFELCMNIRETNLIQSKYCSMFIFAPQDQKLGGFYTGLCVPRSCSMENTILSGFPLIVDDKASLCHSDPAELPKDAWFWIAIALLSFCLLLLTCGLILDLFVYFEWARFGAYQHDWPTYFGPHSATSTEQDGTEIDNLESTPSGSTDNIYPIHFPTESDGQLHSINYADYRSGFVEQRGILFKLLSAFSPVFNAYKLCQSGHAIILDPDGKWVEHPLTCLDGIRVLTMCWIIFGHCLVLTIPYSNNALTYIQEHLRKWTFQVVISTTLSVDTFFMMSGLLTVYTTVPRLRSYRGLCGKLRFWFIFVVHRVLRLTPAYLLVMFLYTGLFIHLTDGPLYPQRPELLDVQYCREHWWVTYLSNFVYTNESCMSWTWYLANELQFSIFLAPVFLTLTYWNSVAGILFALVLIFSSVGSTYAIAYTKNYLPGILSSESFFEILIKPYTRWSTFAIGMLLGRILLSKAPYTWRLFRRKHIIALVVGLTLSAVFCLSTVYGLYGVVSGQQTPLPIGIAALYTALHRPVFIFGVATMVLVCATDLASPIRVLLSWSIFRIPARLTYGAFLVHPIWIYFIVLSSQWPFYLSDINLLMLFTFVLVMSYGTAFLLALVTELPFSTIERLFELRWQSPKFCI